MKTKILTALIAAGIALPTLASAMTVDKQLHSEKARKIFEQLAAEADFGEK